MLDPTRIRAISLDLDDTLWPIWPTIARAEQVLHDWLAQRAPATAALYPGPAALRAIRDRVEAERPELGHDLAAMRRESIRMALTDAGDPPGLAEEGFEVFFAERQRVQLYDGAAQALVQLAARYPLVAVTNGNADLHRVGIAHHFVAAFNAHQFGVAKPDARIFHAAAQAVGVPPQAVLHVGDDATLDAWGAQQAGMQAVWIKHEAAPAWPHENPPPLTVDSLAALCHLLT